MSGNKASEDEAGLGRLFQTSCPWIGRFIFFTVRRGEPSSHFTGQVEPRRNPSDCTENLVENPKLF